MFGIKCENGKIISIMLCDDCNGEIRDYNLATVIFKSTDEEENVEAISVHNTCPSFGISGEGVTFMPVSDFLNSIWEGFFPPEKQNLN